jgi:hypothetical protein
MLWGARLLSPTGIFGSENATAGNGGEIKRHLIFMTDGNSQAFYNNLTAYGSPWYDRELTSAITGVTNGQADTNLTAQISPRTSALCTAIKNMNISLWVISYGTAASSANTMLSNCASPGQFYYATDDAALLTKFKQIASEIAALRLTQ